MVIKLLYIIFFQFVNSIITAAGPYLQNIYIILAISIVKRILKQTS